MREAFRFVATPMAARPRSSCAAGLGIVLACAALTAPAPRADAQELEPRSYSPSPVGTHFLQFGFGRSWGDIIFDPSLPLEDVDGTFNTPMAGYGTTFGLYGRQAQVAAALPYVWGSAEGRVEGQERRITRSGLGDIKARFSINLVGGPALTPQEFAAAKRNVAVGASVVVNVPVGQFDSERLINIGTNRWAFKPEVGLAWFRGAWELDGAMGAWLFTENPEFYTGSSTLQQDPLTSLQAHACYFLRPGLWIAADATWYQGGAVRVDGGPPAGRQNNTRAGVTASIPLAARQSLKLSYSGGASVRVGQNFRTLTAAWQYVWFSGPPSGKR